MTVYLVVDNDDRTVDSVWTTHAAAEDRAYQLGDGEWQQPYHVREMEVDTPDA